MAAIGFCTMSSSGPSSALGGRILGSASPGQASQQRPSSSAAMVLSEYRAHLLELFTHFCGSSSNLALGGWMAFADAFDICPGYLPPDRLEECFDEAAKFRAGSSPSATVALSFTEFQDALCLLAKAVSDKQWKVRTRACMRRCDPSQIITVLCWVRPCARHHIRRIPPSDQPAARA